MNFRQPNLIALASSWFLAAATLCAAEDKWEEFPNGVLGQLAVFEGSDHALIAGYVRKPTGPGPFPLVILLHGGAPTAKRVSAESPEAERALAEQEAVRAGNVLGRALHPPIPEFLAEGWAVYTIDFRTNPRYTLDPLEWDDTAVAVAKARAWPFVDPRRIAMLGGSHGGHVTARMLSREKLSCAVLCAPAGLDLVALAELGQKGTPIGGNQRLVREYEQRAGVKLAEIARDPGRYHYTSPATEIAQVNCPVLLISGRNDPNAPLAVMDLYVGKLRDAGKPAEVYHPDNGPHGFYFGIPNRIPETEESTRRAVAFLKAQFAAANR